MDKTQDVMRGGNKPQPSGLNAIRGGLHSSEKSKKEKVKSLSAVARALSSSEMRCNDSDSQKPKPPKRFKLPKKVFNDCNGVSHASVPRKIRSAMKKRSRESILTGSDKVNHKTKGIESPEKDCIKKSKKQRISNWSKKQVSSGSITKDEEEVVETLYALAGMFPDNGPNVKSELDCGSLPDNSSVLQDKEESANATFEASGTTQNSSLLPEISLMEATKSNSLNETNGQEHTDFAGSAKFLVASHRDVPETNLQDMPMVGRSENGGEVKLHDSSENGGEVKLHDSQLRLEMGLSVSTQSQISHNRRQPDVEFDKSQEQHVIKYQKENEGTALWPGLSPSASAINASYYQSSAAKGSHWRNAAIGAPKKDLMDSCSSGGKISKVVHKKSRKRCAVHVHISHLIRSLEVSKRQVVKEPELYECHQTRVHQGSKSGLLMEAHNLSGMRDGNSSAAGTVPSATVRNSHETTNNGILQKQNHYLDTSQALPTLGMYGAQKQKFNFLSLSAGSNGLKVNDCFNKGGSGRLESMSQSQVSYFESLQKQHGLMPIPTPQNQQHASTSYLDQLPLAGPQVRLQQPHYYGTPLSGAHNSLTSTVSYKQQQQNLWAVQLAAQGGSAVNFNYVKAQYPLDLQSGRHDSSAVTVSPYAQVILPHSPASVHGSKISSISEQQIFSLASSLPSSRTNGRNLHLPSVCDDSRGRLRSSGTPSLQLLCEERV